MKETGDLLFELGTEELPPKALKNMAKSLKESLKSQLTKENINYGSIEDFASPRRLAVIIKNIEKKQQDKKIIRFGPSIGAAFKDGKATPAAVGFAKSCGISDALKLETKMTDKGEKLVFEFEEKGVSVSKLIEPILKKALKNLPIPKMMRWGDHDFSFVRPVHWVLLILDNEIIPVTLFDKKASNITYGHRFHHPEAITIQNPNEYLEKLKANYVLNDWQKRKELVIVEAKKVAEKLNAEVLLDDDLVEEVTAIVEYPFAFSVEFKHDFLRVPKEALISAMQGHQKCFPLVEKNNHEKLINHCITISNIKSEKPEVVIKGNQKVITARLSDAAFFYDTDLKTPLESYLNRLCHVTFQKQLGSMADKSKRIAKLAQFISQKLNATKENSDNAYRAGLLSKCDLMTEMVGEFPELQGIMGRYYAKADGENNEISESLYEAYLPRFSGDILPESIVSQSVSLADRIDTLIGIFGVGLKPTGDKDPFALRRQALGVLRILKEKNLNLDLIEILNFAKSIYQVSLSESTVTDVFEFSMERLKGLYKDLNIAPQIFEAVKANHISNIIDFDHRINAVCQFVELPKAQVLANLNKRVRQILQKNMKDQKTNSVDDQLFEEEKEKALFSYMNEVNVKLNTLLNQSNYEKSLESLTELEMPIVEFFDQVMVMAKDEKVKLNRLALLKQLQQNLNRVADISELAI